MKKFRIQKREHIKLQKEILNVFKTGKQYSDKYLKIFILQNKMDYIRFAISINKKFGNSVMRNKAKRHVRELFRLNKERLEKGYDIIFFIKNEFKNISFSEKREFFLKLLKHSGVLSK